MKLAVTDDVTLFVILGVLVAAGLSAITVLAWSLAVFRQPRALVETGEWREAAIAADRLGRSWMRIVPGIRDGAAYARAACLHLEGKLAESLALTRTLRERGRLAGPIALLEGANLVMLGEDPRRAVERLTTACSSPRSSPEDLLLLALASHSAGDAREAEELFVRAGTARPDNAPSPHVYVPAFHYLRGLYLVKTARALLAAADLEAAAAGPLATIYVERARALIPPTSSDELDPRSSLTPQVIDE